MNNTTRIALIIGLLIIIIVSIYSLLPSKSENDYVSKTEAQRAEKDIWLGSDFNSPFLKMQASFHRLSYYDPKTEYLIEADFSKRFMPDSVALTTSTGEEQHYLIYGEALFTINDIDCTLLLLSSSDGAGLFVPFMDATSGETTYGAGRYLETSMPVNDKILLDFNLAYNPYCAYMEGYSCPFPPKSNVLVVPIEAGEKSFH
jgi:uncharacterized protein (DUF1684 family)